MLAARAAALLGARVLLLEKKPRLGTKILISGGGKCNVTHAGPVEGIGARFRPEEARFLRPSLYRFTNDDFVELLETHGMRVAARPDGRLFPVAPADAHDVVEILAAALRQADVRIRLDAPVAEIVTDGNSVRGVTLADGSTIETRRLIVAVGGSSYPGTGTTGDGWRWLAALGHTVRPLRAALAPLYLDPTPPADWSGVALRDCILRARRVNLDAAATPGREIVHWRGDLLWTHKGVSGPAALGVSREVAEAAPNPVVVEADLLPDEPFEALRDRLQAQLKAFPRRSVADFVETATPNRLVRPLLDSAGIDPTVRGAHLAAKDRNRLVQTLKGWPLGRVRHVPLERGEVVAGGIALGEVDPHSMRSRKVVGLYVCGELLDIAGPVGGYNLQAAWSTGVVAGETAAADLAGTGRAFRSAPESESHPPESPEKDLPGRSPKYDAAALPR
jgi:hypothetical protein